MKKFIYVFVILLITSPTHADSPITSTDFYLAYSDIDVVKQASKDHILTENISDFLLSEDNPIDIKAAVINALSWQEESEKNFKVFMNLLVEKRGSNESEMTLGELSGDELFCSMYLALMGDYSNPQKYVTIMESAFKKHKDSFTVAAIYGLTKAQMSHMETEMLYNYETYEIASEIANNPDNSDWTRDEIVQTAILEGMINEETSTMESSGCVTWLNFEEMINKDNLRQDMREDAKKIVIDYMTLYKKHCDGAEDYWKTSGTRG